MNRPLIPLFVAALVLLPSRPHVIGDETPPQNDVVAMVGDAEIYAAEIHRDVRRATGGRDIKPARYRRVSNSAIEQAVKRRLVLAYLARHKTAASAVEIDQQMDLVKRKLAEQELPLSDYLKRTEYDKG